MDARRASMGLAALGGAVVGGAALVIQYAPLPGTARPVEGPAVELPTPPDAASASAGPVAPTAPSPCPEDMVLVEGDHCPDLEYRCDVPGPHAGCQRYARGSTCRAPTVAKRFCIDRHEWPNEPGELPRVYVDWHESKALCRSVGKRLCARSEWTFACEGPKRLPYPWGFDRQPSPCNVDRPTVPFDVEAMNREDTREGELARLWQADPIGSHPDCVSAFGVHDMAGNVDEWTDERADDPSTGNPSTLNGGYWGPVRNTCRLTTTSHGPDFKFYQVGFRCCADA